MTMVDLDKPVQVLAKEGWHPGVLGIVAGRIMEQISQTVVAVSYTHLDVYKRQMLERLG